MFTFSCKISPSSPLLRGCHGTRSSPEPLAPTSPVALDRFGHCMASRKRLGAITLILSLFSTSALAAPCPIVAKVDGMVCDICARSVEKLLGEKPGVEKTEIDLDTGEVRIFTRPGETLDDEEVKQVIFYSGYDLAGISRECKTE